MCRFGLLLCVLPLLTLLRVEAKLLRNIHPKLSKTCKNIKCPAIDDPVCVKIKFMNADSSNKTLFIYMINNCELEYMKCHQDAEAIIVPKKYCEHTKKPDLVHVRVKRELQIFGNATNANTTGSRRKHIHRHKKALRTEGETDDDHETIDKEEETCTSDEDEKNDSGNGGNEGSGGGGSDGGGSDGVGGGGKSETDWESDITDSNDVGNDSNKKKNNDDDMECPSQCEIRTVMVCGKCQHGVYRTFLSPCHMRMFMCNNENEKLELMSRYPCVQSVPYGSPIEGQLKEPHDEDDVLRFIYCREAKELGSKKINDPRCARFRKNDVPKDLINTLKGYNT